MRVCIIYGNVCIMILEEQVMSSRGSCGGDMGGDGGGERKVEIL